jgi:ABC-2 type transport system permease protein
MNTTRNVTMLIRREIWENRALWIAPLVVTGLILFSAAFGGVHVGNGDNFSFGFSSHDKELSQIDLGHEKQVEIYAKTIGVFTVIQLVALGIVIFFYLLDSLLSERKDRSILFWKSLPISDAEVVSSKALTALVVAPAFVLLVSAFTQLAFGIIWFLRTGSGFPANLLVPFDAMTWLQVQATFLVFVPAVIVWYLPIAGYLLLVSVWARRNAFLWAVLPIAAIQLVEGLLMQSHHVADFIGHRFSGVFHLMGFGGKGDSIDSLSQLVAGVGNVFANYETWLGVLAAGCFFFAIVRIRRYRDDS